MPAVDGLLGESFFVLQRHHRHVDSVRILGEGDAVSTAARLTLETVRDGEPALLESAGSAQRNPLDDSLETAAFVESAVVVEEPFWDFTRAVAELPRHRTQPRRNRLAPERSSSEMAAAVAVQDGTDRTTVVASDHAVLLYLKTECSMFL